jgi:uncharacterized membrane protein
MSNEAKDQPTDHLAIQPGDNTPPESSQMTIEAASWLGPLPPPGALQLFDDVIPGSAERILAMAENQANHRILMESRIIRGDFTLSYIGLAAGFVLSTLVILGGIYLISLGHDWAGSGLIGLNLVGLAGVFVYGSNSRRLQRPEGVESVDENAEPKT